MVTREQLYDQVWSEPMIKVAERYGVSGTYLARVCDVLNVPRPPRGYWQKLAVGKAAPAEALPEALPGDQTSWCVSACKIDPVMEWAPRVGQD